MFPSRLGLQKRFTFHNFFLPRTCSIPFCTLCLSYKDLPDSAAMESFLPYTRSYDSFSQGSIFQFFIRCFSRLSLIFEEHFEIFAWRVLCLSGSSHCNGEMPLLKPGGILPSVHSAELGHLDMFCGCVKYVYN